MTNRFLKSLDRLDVGWSRVPNDGFEAALAEVMVEPAVGASLPFKDVSLEGRDINLNPGPAELKAAKTGVTAAQLAVANYGTVAIESASDATEAASLFPDLHVAVVRASDIVPDMEAAFRWLGEALRDREATVILATGPSATADMGALVRGAHGPKRVHIIILDDQ